MIGSEKTCEANFHNGIVRDNKMWVNDPIRRQPARFAPILDFSLSISCLILVLSFIWEPFSMQGCIHYK
jgi:hypothetical protein